MDLYKTLIETNNWLLDKCKEASKLKNRLGFDTLLKHKDKIKAKGVKDSLIEKKVEAIEEKKEKVKKVDVENNKSGQKGVLNDKRNAFKRRRCITSYGDDSNKETSKEKLENKSALMKSEDGSNNNKNSAGSDVPTKETNKSKKDEFSGFGKASKKQSKFAKSKQPNAEVEENKKEKAISSDQIPKKREESPSNASSELTIGADSINVNLNSNKRFTNGNEKPPSELPQKTLMRSSQSQKFSIFKNYSHNKKSSGNLQNSQSFEQLDQISSPKKSVKSHKSSVC